MFLIFIEVWVKLINVLCLSARIELYLSVFIRNIQTKAAIGVKSGKRAFCPLLKNRYMSQQGKGGKEKGRKALEK